MRSSGVAGSLSLMPLRSWLGLRVTIGPARALAGRGRRRPSRGEHRVRACIALGLEPPAAAQTVEPPFVLGALAVVAQVPVRGPGLLVRVRRRTRQHLAAEAELV